jgi:hypothetical protein
MYRQDCRTSGRNNFTTNLKVDVECGKCLLNGPKGEVGMIASIDKFISELPSDQWFSLSVRDWYVGMADNNIGGYPLAVEDGCVSRSKPSTEMNKSNTTRKQHHHREN